MPVETLTPELTDASSGVTIDDSTELDTIGIELEYPVAETTEDIPVAYSCTSRNLRDEVGRQSSVPAGNAPYGTMTSDHVGAEIISQQLDLHTTAPEVWYNQTINYAQELGYPFSPSGHGETSFGLHMHMSDLSEEKAREMTELSREHWFRLFVCTSLDEESADPWRHGGLSSSDMEGRRNGFRASGIMNNYGTGHYEWRLPEPMYPEHLAMVMHFLRLVESDGVDAARDYAYDAVHSGDERLTAVKQFQVLDNPEWRRVAVEEDTFTDPEVAERTIEILDTAL